MLIAMMASRPSGITAVARWSASTSTIAQLTALVTPSRASNATMIDSTGALTYAPNNLAIQSADMTTASWTKTSVTVTGGVSDPFGGNNAVTVTATGATGVLSQLIPVSGAGSKNFVNTLYIRRRTGTGNISLTTPNGGGNIVSTTGSWQRFSATGLGFSTTYDIFRLVLSTSGDAVDAYAPTGSLVTYETSLRPQDDVMTTTAAYYGPRTPDYTYPSTPGFLFESSARTNLLVSSKADGTSLATQNVTVTAQPYTLSFYGTGSITLSGASTAGPLSGSGAFPTRSTLTFSPTAGTLTLTVSGTVQYAQLEAGSFPTSFIPTDTTSVTRASESLSAAAYSSNPAILQVRDIATGTRSRKKLTTFSSISSETNEWIEEFRVYPVGVSSAWLDAHLVVDGAW